MLSLQCLTKYVVVLFAFASLLVSSMGENLSSGVDVDDYVREHVNSVDVMVFAKSYCPYCRKTRDLLNHLQNEHSGWTLDIVDLDRVGSDGPLIQMELLQQTHQRTVPNVFIGGQHIGGNSDLQELHDSGKLDQMLEELEYKHKTATA